MPVHHHITSWITACRDQNIHIYLDHCPFFVVEIVVVVVVLLFKGNLKH